MTHLKELVRRQKECEVEILLCLYEVRARRLDLKAGFSNTAEFCQEVFGMSAEVAWKKARAAKIIGPFPKLFELLKEGKTHVSHIAMVANRITQANCRKIYEFLPGASKRDLQFFLDRLLPDGSMRNMEPTIEVKIRVSREFLEKLDHAAGLLAKTGSGAVANRAKVLESGLDALIEKRDPVKRAERASARARKKLESSHGLPTSGPGSSEKATRGLPTSGSGSSEEATQGLPVGGPGSSEDAAVDPGSTHSRPRPPVPRPPIPAKVKHHVFLRDKGRCTYVSSDGRRCSERSFLHLDHITPWCLGGSHRAENLRTLCANHNNFQAEVVLGQDFMRQRVGLETPREIGG